MSIAYSQCLKRFVRRASLFVWFIVSGAACLFGQGPFHRAALSAQNDLNQKAIRRLIAGGGFGVRPFSAQSLFRPAITSDNWLGGVGNWNSTNWSTGSMPNSTNNAVIANSTPAAVVTLNVSDTINNLTIGSTSVLSFANNTALTIGGNTITNSNKTGSGGITLNSVGNYTELIIGNSAVTLTGGGTVSLSNNSANLIYGAAGSDVLTNSNNIIQGSGNIGDNQMRLVNQGTINANQSTPLTIQTSTGTTNAGTLEATAGANLILQGDTYTNTGGTILASGTGSVVTLAGPTINGGTLKTAGGGMIQGSGSVTVLNAVTNSGTYQLPNNTATTINGTITNSGTIQLNSVGNYTELIAGGSGATLSGGGTVSLSNNSANVIYGAAGADGLTNTNNTIQGSGNIGDNQMTLVNQATINANQATALTIQTSNGATNTGTLEATAGGNLVLQGDTYTNTGGTILASGTGSVVTLLNPTIKGGTLSTSNGGVIQASNSGTVLNGVTNSGTYQLPNNTATTLVGTMNNTGSIQVNSAGNNTLLYQSGAVTLQGGGSVTLSDNNNNYFLNTSSGDSLTNVNNTISGSGNIGNNSMAFANQAGGTVNAVSAAGNTLTIETGASGATNLGLMEASSGGTLQLEDNVVNTNGTRNGTIKALTGGSVLLNGATISGGTITTAGTGVITAVNGAQLDGSTNTITNAGSLQLPNNNSLYMKGTLNNTGSLSINSAGNNTLLYVNSPTATLQGSGSVALSDNNNNYIQAASSGNQLTIKQTIQGPGGDVGNGNLVIVNQSTIDATASAHGNTLTIQPGGTLTNTGTLEATGGGSLALYGGTFTNTGGTITAGAGSNVTLEGNVTVTGGALNGAGTFTTLSGSTLNGITNAGAIVLPNNNGTTLVGTISNTGSLQVNSAGNNTLLSASGPVSLTGKGTLTLSDNNANYLLSSGGSSDSLTNVNNTISGSGNIGNGGMPFTNQAAGVVDATSTHGNSLVINSGAAGATNAGLMEASSGATLVLQGAINNSGGTIEGLAGTGTSAGGAVLINGATITGGTLKTLGTGANASSMTAESSAILNSVTNNGTIGIPNNNSAQLEGTVTNNGSIQVNSAGNFTFLYINGNTTLNGNGSIALSNNSNNFVEGATGTEVLTNNGNTIEGSGNLGNGALGLVNNAGGTILANQSVPLTVHPNASGFTNNGTVQVNTGSLLDITGPFNNFNSTTNTLTGGSYNVNGGTLQFDNANIVTNAAKITLTGAASQIVSNTNANALANFATNAAGAVFTLGAGRSFTTAGNFTNNGALVVGSGDTFKVSGRLTNFSNSTLTGGSYFVTGTLRFGASGSSLTTNSAVLSLNGSGAKVLDLGGNNLLANFNNQTTSGSFTVTGGASFTTSGAFSNSGIMDLEKGGQLTISGDLTNGGTVSTNNANNQGAANVLTVTGSYVSTNGAAASLIIGANNDTSDRASIGLLNNGGTVSVGTGAALTLTKAGTDANSGNININGTLDIKNKTTFNGTGAIDLTNGAITGLGTGPVFTNANFLHGSGTISNLAITNAKNITADQAAPLIILPSSAGLNNTGTLAVSAGSTMQIGTSAGGALVNFSGNTLTGGEYAVSGTMQFGASGTVLATNAANISLSGAGAQMIDFGNNNMLLGFNNNATGGVFSVNSGAVLTTTAGNFTNSGTFTVGSGSTFTVGGSSFNYTQGAGTTTVDGTLTSSTLGTVAVNGGSLFGTGTVSDNVVDSGVLSPGDSIAKAGRLTVADTYSQTSTGALDIAIGGTTAGVKYDQLKVSQSASLGGTLNITLTSGFTPAIGQTFAIVNAQSLSGTFATVNGLSINSSEHFTISYNGTSAVLKVVSGPLALPASTVTLARFGAGDGHYIRYVYRPVETATITPTIAFGARPVATHSANATLPHRTTGMHGFRPMDSSPVAMTVVDPASLSYSGASAYRPVSPVSAAALNGMSAMNRTRFECGVDVKALLKTRPKRLLKALYAEPDSADALAIGYVSYVGGR